MAGQVGIQKSAYTAAMGLYSFTRPGISMGTDQTGRMWCGAEVPSRPPASLCRAGSELCLSPGQEPRVRRHDPLPLGPCCAACAGPARESEGHAGNWRRW